MPRAARGARGAGDGRLSLRAFAKLVGVSQPAVSKGIRSGRLSRSVGRARGGRPFIADPKLARREWKENAARLPSSGLATTPRASPKGATLAEAQRRVADERARGLFLANQVREGLLIEASWAKRESYEAARIVRESILSVADRVAAELAGETDAARVHARLEEELRLALSALADLFEEPSDADDARRDDPAASNGRLSDGPSDAH